MDLNNSTHIVAYFMYEQFKYELSKITSLRIALPKPTPPMSMGAKFLDGCLYAVRMCVTAFVNPRMLKPCNLAQNIQLTKQQYMLIGITRHTVASVLDVR